VKIKVNQLANAIRFLSIDAVQKAGIDSAELNLKAYQ